MVYICITRVTSIAQTETWLATVPAKSIRHTENTLTIETSKYGKIMPSTAIRAKREWNEKRSYSSIPPSIPGETLKKGGYIWQNAHQCIQFVLTTSGHYRTESAARVYSKEIP